MLLIICHTIAGAGLLIIMPVLVWISGWQWQPINNTWWYKILFLVAETVTKPWGIVTHLFICLWFLWCLHFRLRETFILFCILTTVIVLGQGIKSWMKIKIHKPRPFILWLETSHNIPVNKFYDLKFKDRDFLIKKYLLKQREIPPFLLELWQKETEFACPSGHTIFASSWVLLSIGLLWQRKKITTVVILIIWTSILMSSRIALGMHWPQDLIVAIFISWLLVTIATWFVQKYLNHLLIMNIRNKNNVDNW